MDILNNNWDQITEFCQKHRVENLYAFGSILSRRFQEDKDIDLLEVKTLNNPYLRKAKNINF